jgi:hypothetical protein
MSEYQYYEFRAVDRALAPHEMRELRNVSSRATITPTRFVNHYEWGDFKGDPSVWMERYFDAFLYFANWGTRLLKLRLPRGTLNLRLAQTYCRGDSAHARVKDEFLILEFGSEDEGGEEAYFSAEDDLEEGHGALGDLLALRAEIASGDHRALYLAWLLCVDQGDLDDDESEPPVPPGLGALSAAQQAFAEFLRIDDDLIAVAAERSAEIDDTGARAALAAWIASLPESDKTDLLVRLAGDEGLSARAELLRRFRAAQPAASCDLPARSIAELIASAEQRAAERERRAAEAAARERVKREREAAAQRARYLASLVGREADLWRKIDTLVASAQPRAYDEAVTLVKDLWDLGQRTGAAADAADRIRALTAQHARKGRFIERLDKAGLGGRKLAPAGG